MDRETLRTLFDMDGRVVLVTGGTRGIGRALAEGYACAGAKVAVVSRNADSCKQAEEHLRSLGAEAIGFPGDVGDVEQVGEIIERTVAGLGGLDVLVNNAATGPQHRVGQYEIDDWQQVFDINVKGPVFLIQEALPHLKQSGCAAVLNILSGAGFLNSRLFPIYGSTKAALFAHTRAAAAELAQHGIRVNAIAPGPFGSDALLGEPPEVQEYTAQVTLLKRWAELDEAVGPALLLTSDAGSYITGQVLMVDGGMVVAR